MLTVILVFAFLDLAALTWSLEKADGVVSSFWFLLGVVLASVAMWNLVPGFSAAMVFEWMSTHTAPILVGVGSYVLVGAGYSVAKWYTRMRDVRAFLEERFTTLLPLKQQNYPGKDIDTDALRRDIAAAVIHTYHVQVEWDTDNQRHVLTGSFKNLVIPWMTFWPLFLVYQMCDYLLYRAWERIYRTLERAYTHIANTTLNG